MSSVYTYSVSGDTLNGKVYVKNLKKEIEDSTIVTALDSGRIDVSGDYIEIYFKAALSTGDQTTLDSIVAIHTGENGDSSVEAVRIEFSVGGMATILDGTYVKGTDPDTWYSLQYHMEEPKSIHGAVLIWHGCWGDIGHMAVINPGGKTNPASIALQGANSVEVDPLKAPYFDPSNGCTHVEIWDSTGQLIGIYASKTGSGTTLTIADGLSFPVQLETDFNLVPRVGGYCPVRGAEGIDGGIRLVGNGSVYYQNTHGITNPIPQGMCLCMRMKTSSETGTRYFAINYDFRE